MTIININNDDHRLLLVAIGKQDIEHTIVWQKGTEYCLDFPNHGCYTLAKSIQVRLEHQTNRRMPHI